MYYIIIFPNLQKGILNRFILCYCVSNETPASFIQQMHKYTYKSGVFVKESVDLQINDK